jgi:tripartite-type tricarboxylate transporter receptor subunit TctC
MTHDLLKALLGGAAALLLGATGALAQESWPNGPVTIVVPYGAGGGNDTVARALADPLSKVIGVPVVVENHPGAGASVGVMYFNDNAQPDGQMLLISSTSAHSTVPLLNEVTYDSATDFEPLVRITNLVEAMVVHKDVPVHNPTEFMEWAKANADTITMTYGAVGSQGWSAVEQLNRVLGFEIAAVPVASGAASEQTALVAGGHVNAAVVSLTTALPFMETGDVRLIAFVQEARDPRYPDVHTFLDDNINIRVGDEVSIYAKAGTPEDIKAKIDAAVHQVLDTPEFATTLENLGLFVNYGDSATLKEIVAARTEIAKELVATTN